jgi:hypothetical protein
MYFGAMGAILIAAVFAVGPVEKGRTIILAPQANPLGDAAAPPKVAPPNSNSVASQLSHIPGSWVLDLQKSDFGLLSAPPGRTDTVAIANDMLTIVIKSDDDRGSQKLSSHLRLTFSLDDATFLCDNEPSKGKTCGDSAVTTAFRSKDEYPFSVTFKYQGYAVKMTARLQQLDANTLIEKIRIFSPIGDTDQTLFFTPAPE